MRARPEKKQTQHKIGAMKWIEYRRRNDSMSLACYNRIGIIGEYCSQSERERRRERETSCGGCRCSLCWWQRCHIGSKSPETFKSKNEMQSESHSFVGCWVRVCVCVCQWHQLCVFESAAAAATTRQVLESLRFIATQCVTDFPLISKDKIVNGRVHAIWWSLDDRAPTTM